ncbi:MAG: replication associated protein [Wigfec virus K19_668]|nr:MAG: replication associated protein [Wigfec virus K19_668]
MKQHKHNTEVGGNSQRQLKQEKADRGKRGYFLTINNPTKEDEMGFHTAFTSYKGVYAVWQHEIGEETHTPHIQGFIHFKNTILKTTVERIFPRAHVLYAIDNEACIIYCTKEETRTKGPFELGIENKPAQGNRNDLDQMATDFRRLTTSEFIELYPAGYVRYHRGLTALRHATTEHRDRNNPPSVFWLWGPAGCRKTRTAVESHNTFYIKDGTQWWDNYNQEEAIIIDDFDGRWPYRDLLRLLDRYPYQGQTKGGYVKINSPYIYITCEFPPEEFWRDNELAQIMRRITKVENLGKCTRLSGASTDTTPTATTNGL